MQIPMKIRNISIYAVMVSLLMAGCHKKENQHAENIPDIEVTTPVVDSIVLHKTYPGYLNAGKMVDVVGEVSGRLLSSNFRSGDYVKQGQVLYTIDATTYRQALERAEASLRTANAQYAYAAKQYAALQKAIAVDAVSKMEVLQAKSNMDQYAAQVESAKSSVATAKTSLDKCVVRAPISGYITNGRLDPGAYVNGEGSPVALATIYDNSSLTVAFSIEDSQYELMVGQGGISKEIYRKVPLKFEKSLPHAYFTDLYFEAPDVERSTGTLLLKGKLKNEYNELKDGMYCTVNLPYGSEPEAILVKDASIGTDQLGKYMYVVNDSNKVVYTHIEVGDIYQDSMRLVTKGLKPNDRYVTVALLKVRNGMKINPKMVR